jgi:hypothetical protein
MTCKHNMVHLDTKTEDDFNFENFYHVKIFQNWECELCGETEKVDVTEDMLCENPYY